MPQEEDFGLTKYEQKILLVIYRLKMEPTTHVITTKTITRVVGTNRYRLPKALGNLERYGLIRTNSRSEVIGTDKWKEYRENFKHAPELSRPNSRLISITEDGLAIGQALNRLSQLQRYGMPLIDEYERLKGDVVKAGGKNLELEFIKKQGREPLDADKAAMAILWSIELCEGRKNKGGDLAQKVSF